MNLSNQIGLRLKQAIDESRYNQASLAREIGCSKSAITELIKTGKVQRSSIFEKIVQKLKLNKAYILKGEGEVFNNYVEEPQATYSTEISKLQGQIELLKEQLKEKDKYIAELMSHCHYEDKSKKGRRSG